MVKDGHKTPYPQFSRDVGVVSHESIRMALMYAALNGLRACNTKICNAYLQEPSSKKHFIICGPDFFLDHVGKVALVQCSLYGGKITGHNFWQHLRKFKHHLGFTWCKANPDL